MSKTPLLKPGFRFGILGGGQLARMLCQSGAQMGCEMHVFSESSTDPAAQVTAFHHQGSAPNTQALKTFLQQVEMATFESEFMDADLLTALAQETGTTIYPQPSLMRLLQDRLTQKQLLEQALIPTAPFLSVQTEDDFQLARKQFLKGFVLKKRRFGYDGKGTFVVRERATFDFQPDPFHYIAESFVPFRREMAAIFFRNSNGDICEFPLVETKQEHSRCLWVMGPMEHRAWPQLARRLRRWLDQIQLVGSMAFELFDWQDQLWVNEIAPRVHNSAHYSQDALSASQFHCHLAACLNMDLPSTVMCKSNFAMYNVLATGAPRIGWNLSGDTALHWYGKKENPKGRKMGHINVLGTTPRRALATATKLRKSVRV